MNIAFIQCRYNSTRLPGKALMQILNKPVLQHVIERVSKSKQINKIWVLTGKNKCNDAIEELCIKNNISCYRGENDNVLKRFCDLLLKINCKLDDRVIRITADCPLIDYETIDNMIEQFDNNQYLGNQNNMIDGFDVEIMTVKQLYYALMVYKEDEHVTLKWKKDNQDLIKYYNYDNINRSNIHLSLDTQKDYTNIKKIYETLGENFTYKDVIKYLECNNV